MAQELFRQKGKTQVRTAEKELVRQVSDACPYCGKIIKGTENSALIAAVRSRPAAPSAAPRCLREKNMSRMRHEPPGRRHARAAAPSTREPTAASATSR